MATIAPVTLEKSIQAGEYKLTFDEKNGGVIRSLTWRGIDVLRPASAHERDALQSAMFPLVPFSNRLESVNLPDLVPRRLPLLMSGCDLPIHGFGWKNEWQIENLGESEVSLSFDDTFSPWPCPYKAVQHFQLSRSGLQATLSVTNTGSRALPAGIGFHPYFPKADCLLTIGLETKWEQGELGLPLEAVPSGWSSMEHVTIANRRLDHSFSGWNGDAQMRWPKRNLAVELISDEVLREVVIYSPAEDFFCLEPVSHLTNAMFAKSESLRRGWRTIEPGETLTGTINISARTIV